MNSSRFLPVSLLSLVLFSGRTFAQYDYQPTQANLQAREQFQDDKFGVFIHWGLYAMQAHGEWVMQIENQRADEYALQANAFYPARFDAREWVRLIKASGARYLTITTRHHDGFSMFATKASPYNLVDATPFKRDVLRELADACAEEGVHLQFYYSHLDWSRPDYPLGETGRSAGRPTQEQDYNHYYRFMEEQLTELLTQYGPVRTMWFDGIWDHEHDSTPFNWHLTEQYEMIHRLQPQCLILNNHHHTPNPGEDLQGFEQDLPGENTHGKSGQAISAYPLETCMTMNESWGYDVRDKQYKSADCLIQHLVRAAGKNCNLLLNVGPRPDGQFPEEAEERLQAMGQWLKANGETIYGTRGGLVPPQEWGVTTQRGNTLYVHILQYQEKDLYLPVAPARVAGASLFPSGEKIKWVKSGEGIMLHLPAAPKGVDTILTLNLL